MTIYNSTAYELGVRNMDAVVANLYRFDAVAQEEFRGVVEETSHDVSDLTVMLAPKRTHFMAEHVRERITKGGLAFDVGWDAADFFDVGLAFYPFFQELGTSRMAAQPSVGPAWEHHRPVFRDRISAAARRAAQRLSQSRRRTR